MVSHMGLESPSRHPASSIGKKEGLRTVAAVVAVIAVSHVTAIGVPVIVCRHCGRSRRQALFVGT